MVKLCYGLFSSIFNRGLVNTLLQQEGGPMGSSSDLHVCMTDTLNGDLYSAERPRSLSAPQSLIIKCGTAFHLNGTTATATSFEPSLQSAALKSLVPDHKVISSKQN